MGRLQKVRKLQKEARDALRKLEQPVIDGTLNLCYGDGYYAKSIVARYGSIERCREIAAGDVGPEKPATFMVPGESDGVDV